MAWSRRYDVTGGVTDRVIDMRDVTENVITNNNNVPSLRIIAARPDPGGAGRSKSFVAELLRDGLEFLNAILQEGFRYIEDGLCQFS